MSWKTIKRRPSSARLAGLALVFLILSSCLSVGTAVAAAADISTAPHKLCLWRVSGGKGTVFILGSIHIAKADLYPLPREIEQAFTSANYLVEEVDPSKADPAAAREFWASHGRYADGDRLEKHLSDRTAMALGLYLEMTGRPPTALSSAKPWLAYLILEREKLRRYGYLSEQGIDRHFFDEATASHKPVIALETPDYQMQLVYWLFSTRSEGEQDHLLLWELLRARYAARRLGAMFQAWRAGDTAAMEALLRDEKGDPRSQLYDEEVVYKRNLRMAQQLEVYLNTSYTYFVVVGSAHVVGDRGIVKLLEGRGYRIEQLSGH
jgi:uncharacterized protein YbaP (TraB family)